MRLLLTGASALALLAACAAPPAGGAGGAGEIGREAGFGSATLNNALVQSGQRDVAVSLSRRFAAEVPTTVNFAFNSDALDAEARRVLAAQASFIRAFPELRFAVFGHADLVGSERYNHELGLRRARAAVAYLASQGVDPSRLEALISEGETMPLVPTPSPERANRRTVTDVRGFVQSHPGVMNGKYAEIVFRDYVESAVGDTTLSQEVATGETAEGG